LAVEHDRFDQSASNIQAQQEQLRAGRFRQSHRSSILLVVARAMSGVAHAAAVTFAKSAEVRTIRQLIAHPRQI
jgi:hypothetical protein